MSELTSKQLDAMEKQNEVLGRQVKILKKLKRLQKSTGFKLGKAGPAGASKPRKAGSKKKKSKPPAAAQPPAAKKRRTKVSLQMTKAITIRSPKTNALMKVGGKKNRAFRTLVEDARRSNFEFNKEETEHLVNALAQCYKQGVLKFEPWFIPKHVQKKAARMAGVDIGLSDTGGSAASTDGDRPQETETFKGKFIRYLWLMDGEKFGRGLQEDLAHIQSQVMSQLKFVRQEKFHGRPFKMYLDYEFVMTRKPMFTSDGVQVASTFDEESIHHICTAEGGPGPISIRHPSSCDEAVGKCYGMIMQQFSNLVTQGSGWAWSRSVNMQLCVSKQVDGVALRGGASDAKVAEICAADEVLASGTRAEAAPPPPDPSPGLEDIAVHTGGSHLPLPKWVNKEHKAKCFFNPHPITFKEADQNLCFSWAILRALHPYGVVDPKTGKLYEGLERSNERFHRGKSNSGRALQPGETPAPDRKLLGNVADLAIAVQEGKLQHIILPEGVSYPVPISAKVFREVEELNDISLSVFLMGDGGRAKLTPFVCSHRMKEGRPHVRLALMQSKLPVKAKRSVVWNFEADQYNNHFVLVTDIVGLLGKVSSRKNVRVTDALKPGTVHAGEWHAAETLYCDNCLNRFSNAKGSASYLAHLKACVFDSPTEFRLPVGDKAKLRFDKWGYTETHPFVIYADFEAINAPDEKKFGQTQVLSMHEVCCWAYQIVVAPEYKHLFDAEPGYMGKPFTTMRSMVGKDIMGCFFEALKTDTDVMHSIVKGPRGDVEMEWDTFKSAEDPSGEAGYEKVRAAATACRFCAGSFPGEAAEDDPANHVGKEKVRGG